MTKSILSFVLAGVAMVATAQTQENPLAIVSGENSYTDAAFSTGSTIYYTYENKTAQDQVLLLSNVTKNATFAGYVDDEATVHSQQNDRECFEVPAGKTLSVVASAYSKTVAFTASAVTTDLDAEVITLPAEGTDTYLPAHGGNSATLTYRAEKDGMLSICFNHAQFAYPTYKDSKGNGDAMGYNADMDGTKVYCAKLLITKGETYTFTFSNLNPELMDTRVDEVAEGNSIEGPFTVDEKGEYTLPAKAGHYWYQVNRSVYLGYHFLKVTLNDDDSENLPGGSVKLYTSTTENAVNYSVNNHLLVRMPVVAAENAQYYMRIDKKVATDADQTITITTDMPIPEDSAATAPVIYADSTYTTPLYNGTYQYYIDVPSQQGNCFLVINGGDKAQHSTVQVCPSYQYQTYIGRSSNGYLRCPVNGGQSYYIVWKTAEDKNAFPFTISYEEIKAGEIESQPLSTVANKEYTVPANETRYFIYVPNNDCNLQAILSDPDANVVFKKSGYNNITVASTKEGNVAYTKALKETSYLVCVTANDDDVIVKLHEGELPKGESVDNPIEITSDTTALPAAKLDSWYSYTAKNAGMVRVQSNIEYEQDPSNPTHGTDIKVRVGDTGAIDQSAMGFDASYHFIYDKSFAVEAGETVYIHVITYSAQADKTLSVSFRNYEPGEASSYPIELVNGENTLPAVNSMTAKVWYAMNLGTGSLSMACKTPSKSFGMNMYKENDLETVIAKVERSGDWDSGFKYALNYDVTEAGRYIFQLTSAQQGQIIVVDAPTMAVNGDVTDDGTVDIADVNAIIAVICGNTTNNEADVNGDGTVDISDVNAVISIICGGAVD